MNKKEQKYFYLTLMTGVLFLASYFLTDFLYEKLWFFYLVPLFVFGLGFLVTFILTITKKVKQGIVTGVLIIGVYIVFIMLNSEIFKSKIILEASLIDDISAIHLTLRENNQFEIVASNIFTDETFIGKYKISENKIVFKDKQYNNDFIPDTVYIIENKIICKFDGDGNPVTDFATYFEIKVNKLKPQPNKVDKVLSK